MRSPLPRSETWKYAVIGGVASMPLTIGYYWLSGAGNDFSTGMIFFGGLLAGYLAKESGLDPVSSGFRAGVVGGLPGYIWILPGMVRTGTRFATAWSSSVAATVVMAFFAIAIVATAVLPGLVGGYVGGWLVEKVTGKRPPLPAREIRRSTCRATPI